ncbi:MAG: ABC transporter ATP-binding protein [Candidatus Eisenbacteria bacterium]
MIRVTDLTMRFGHRVALSGVSFEVRRGELAVLLGPNGAGKTTTLRILTGSLSPDSGSAELSGFNLRASPLEARRRTGFLPERVPLDDRMKVRSYLRFVSALKEIDRKDRERSVGRALERCGAARVSERRIGGLSHGYRQRVGLAQALLGDPEVLLLDEPTAGLDPEQTAGLREVLAGLKGERTLLISMHDLDEASRLADRALVLHEGTLIADGELKELVRESATLEEVYLRLIRGEG